MGIYFQIYISFSVTLTFLLLAMLFEMVKLIRYITSDCDAVSIIYEDQKIVKTPEDAVVDVLNAGNVGPSISPFLFF